MNLRLANFILLVALIAVQGVLFFKQTTLIRTQQATINQALRTATMQQATIQIWKERAMACEGLVKQRYNPKLSINVSEQQTRC